jgi:hypothetical protein
VTGGLDLVADPIAHFDLAQCAKVPVLVIYGAQLSGSRPENCPAMKNVPVADAVAPFLS